MKLRPIKDELLASHLHRSGWPYAMRSLEPLFQDNAEVLFDDFFELTFHGRRNGFPDPCHDGPWVGVCHHPPDAPWWYATERPHSLVSQPGWATSLENLRLCIALSENVAAWVRAVWNVPCVCIRHPSEVPDLLWSPERFLKNQSKLLIQVAWYLRNTHAIHQGNFRSEFTKAWLRQTSAEILENHRRCGISGPNREAIGTVREIAAVDNTDYDELLAENVVFVELFAAGANNTVVECIARNTPIVINRLPGPEHYLGSEYPLFYDDFGTLHDLVSIDRVLAAHDYLKSLDKGWLDGEQFLKDVRAACTSFVPEFQKRPLGQ